MEMINSISQADLTGTQFLAWAGIFLIACGVLLTFVMFPFFVARTLDIYYEEIFKNGPYGVSRYQAYLLALFFDNSAKGFFGEQSKLALRNKLTSWQMAICWATMIIGVIFVVCLVYFVIFDFDNFLKYLPFRKLGE